MVPSRFAAANSHSAFFSRSSKARGRISSPVLNDFPDKRVIFASVSRGKEQFLALKNSVELSFQ